jgi:hypothetical protein
MSLKVFAIKTVLNPGVGVGVGVGAGVLVGVGVGPSVLVGVGAGVLVGVGVTVGSMVAFLFLQFLNEDLLLQLADGGTYPPFIIFILLQEQLHL